MRDALIGPRFSARRIQSQITLRELVEQPPLQHGLGELVAYLQRGAKSFKAAADESIEEASPGM